jgi:exonuclease 3'-5' domain-containing protein 1
VFDTQAAYAVLQQQQTGKPVHTVKNISLNDLCKELNAPVNTLKKEVKNVYISNPRYWTKRPLTQTMICYAAADVLPLHALHKALASQIKPEYADLLAETCLKHVLHLISDSGGTSQCPETRKEEKKRETREEIMEKRKNVEEDRRKKEIVERIEIERNRKNSLDGLRAR